MWIHGNSVPVEHLNLIKMSTPEPQIRRGHTHCHTRVPQEDLPTYKDTHAHPHATGTRHTYTTHTQKPISQPCRHINHRHSRHTYILKHTHHTHAHVATHTLTHI